VIRTVTLALICALVMSACGEDHLLGTELEKNMAPDFTLPSLDHKATVHLAEFRGSRPVVLVFGSYT